MRHLCRGSLGGSALFTNSDGSFNTALGYSALRNNTGGNATCTDVGAPLSCCTGSGQGVCTSSNTAVGADALYYNTTGNSNSAVGASALQDNISGANNTAIGEGALTSNTTGAANTALGQEALDADASGCNDTGTKNTAVGQLALSVNNGGSNNAALGQAALQNNTTGDNNTALGQSALVTNTMGQRNTAVGVNALQSNTTASGNTAVGAHALYDNDSDHSGKAINNTAVGLNALYNNSTGTSNIAIGFGAGTNVVFGSNDIYIGTAGSGDESNAIRIGGTQTATFVAGIHGATSSGGVGVFVDSNGQLGTITSSARFKENIQGMGDSTSGLLKLRAVRFRYKKDIDPSGLEQYGLVAEEVAKVYPGLVSNDAEGRPYTVRYQFLAPMLLNEVQKQARQITALQKQVEDLVTLKAATAALQAQVEALDTPRTVANRRSRRAQDARPAAF